MVPVASILEGLETRRTGWWPFAEKHYYDPVVLDRDVRRIETFLALRGFFAAKVIDRRVIDRPGGRAVDVLLKIDEGQPTSLTDVQVRGLESVEPALAERLRRGLSLPTGERFDHDRYAAARARLQEQLVGAGHAYATVTGRVEVDRARRTARIGLEAAPGPLVRFGAAHLEGEGPIPKDKLLHLLTWRRGEVFNPDEVVRSRARLFNQRVFASVRIDLPKEPTPEADMRIRVLPTKLRELRLGVGFGLEKQRQEVRLSGRYTIRNFLGGLRTLELRLQPAYVIFPAVWAAVDHGPALASEIKLTQPDLWSTGIMVFGSLGYDLGIQEGYQYHGPKVQLGGERAFFRDRLRTGLSWNLQLLEFFNIKDVFDASSTTLGVGFQNPYRLAWFEEFGQLDLRDQLIDPRAGFWGEVRLEQGFTGIGSAFTYLKVTPDLRGYLPLGTRRLVLALRVQLGYLLPRGDADSPITRRLALGGPNSHRGFTFGRLSPQVIPQPTTDPPVYEGGIPYGGNASLLGSADLRLRLGRLFDNWLSLIGFFDAGDVTPSFAELALSRLHLAVGGSLQYQTPIGAIRIGIGVRLNRLEDVKVACPQFGEGRLCPTNPDPGSRLAFHITLGEAF